MLDFVDYVHLVPKCLDLPFKHCFGSRCSSSKLVVSFRIHCHKFSYFVCSVHIPGKQYHSSVKSETLSSPEVKREDAELDLKA